MTKKSTKKIGDIDANVQATQLEASQVEGGQVEDSQVTKANVLQAVNGAYEAKVQAKTEAEEPQPGGAQAADGGEEQSAGLQDAEDEPQVEKPPRRRQAPPRPKQVTLRNRYYLYTDPTALIDTCYHDFRINDRKWHRDDFYEKIVLSDWTLTLNDVVAMVRLEPDFKHALRVVRELIYKLKIRDTKFIDGQFHGNEFDHYELMSLLKAIAPMKSNNVEEMDQHFELVKNLPGPINMKRLKRRALRVGVSDIRSAVRAFKAGVISAKEVRTFCFGFELDGDHPDYNDAFARCTELPK